MGFLSNLFGGTSKQDKIIEMVNNGGIIIDVRSPQEFKSGHIPGSQNIPLDVIHGKADSLKKMNKPLILCCASGMRSSQAVNILKNKGIEEIVNAGSWRSLT